MLCVCLATAALPSRAGAETPAAANNHGNRLFDRGRYGEAEKDYMRALGKNPDTPEAHYNLGNALIKQGKHEAGIGSLERAVVGKNRIIRQRGWYNIGNAQYALGRYRESADAFIEALKLNPSDRDAKHNLEMALKNIEDRQQSGGSVGANDASSQNRRQKGEGNPAESSQGKVPHPTPGEAPQDGKTPPGSQNDSRKTLDREQSLRILDAVQSREIEERRRQGRKQSPQHIHEKDW